MTRCNSINNYEDRSHLSVKLFANKLYKLEIQLYCVEVNDDQSVSEEESLRVGTNCNTAHYVDVWIDLNNDGNFDETTERFYQNDKHDDGHMKGHYDINITIPQIVDGNDLQRSHILRIVLSRDSINRQPCNNVGYGEVRDYNVYILPNSYF